MANFGSRDDEPAGSIFSTRQNVEWLVSNWVINGPCNFPDTSVEVGKLRYLHEVR